MTNPKVDGGWFLDIAFKYGLIHLLPIFQGLENEDLLKFLMEFYMVCSGMKFHVLTEDQIKLGAFPFSV